MKLQEIKDFAVANFQHDDFLSMLVKQFGGEVQNTGGGCMVYGLSYDAEHMVSISDECLIVVKAANWDEWYENSDECVAEHTIWFRETDTALIEAALNAACQVVQKSLWVKSGDVAGAFWADDENRKKFDDAMRPYIAMEKSYMADPVEKVA